MPTPDYREFWGKARRAREAEPLWHPVAYHSLDVAAVAEALLVACPRRLEHLALLLGTPPENAKRFTVCLVALHDVGKFSKHFQAKSAEVWPLSAGKLLGPHAIPPPSRHDRDGNALRDHLDLSTLMKPATSGWCATDFATLWNGICGHHGQPANGQQDQVLNAGFPPPCIEAARTFSRDVRALFEPFDAIAQPSERALAVVSWLLCGLTVVADWIGSNRDWFPYQQPLLNLGQYWTGVAKPQASIALNRAGIMPRSLPKSMNAARLFPELADSLSPLQRHVASMTLPEGPMLAVVEDVTGSGKTEAALLLAGRLMQAGRADGLFFALPTMATATAMYDRLAKSYERLFADGARPSLVLAHGKRALNKAFQDSIFEMPASGPSYEGDAATVCADWIADDRRKAFLAHVGVGTIDQALLSVLPSRHQVLRLWGLSDRVLIIDEAHAYDAYMSRETERLLEFHAALGGSAIVLSATLPDAQRRALTSAFAKGLGIKPKSSVGNDYPLLTVVAAAGQTSQPVATREDRTRTLPVRGIGTFAEAVDQVTASAGSGCAVAWIRNSVEDAIEAVEKLHGRDVEATLLHARFAMGDRLDIEKRVCSTLGRVDETGNRAGFVVVGTQILEQSLDYDVDVMISDLAPIDLLIQRAGRLWRHTDRARRPVDAPDFVVLSPDPDKVEDAKWYHQVSPRAAAVYGHHGIVWRGAKLLFERGDITTPDGVRPLVEGVYGPTELEDIPPPLQHASKEAEGRRRAERSIGGASLLKLELGYGGETTIWNSDQIVQTRLGDPVTVFRLAKIEGERIVPYYPDENLGRAWALSEVSLSRRKADGVPPDRDRAKLVENAKATWPNWEQDTPLLILERRGDGWWGLVSKEREGTKPAHYDQVLGLRIVTP